QVSCLSLTTRYQPSNDAFALACCRQNSRNRRFEMTRMTPLRHRPRQEPHSIVVLKIRTDKTTVLVSRTKTLTQANRLAEPKPGRSNGGIPRGRPSYLSKSRASPPTV